MRCAMKTGAPLPMAQPEAIMHPENNPWIATLETAAMPQLIHPPSRPAGPPDLSQDTPSGERRQNNPSQELGGLANKVRRNWQDYGWSVTLNKILAYLVRSIYFRQTYRVYRIDLDKAISPPGSGTQDFKFRILTAQDSDAIAQIESIAEWLRGELKEAIAAGHPCLVALDGERVAGFNLINLEHATLRLVSLTRKLRKGCAWSEHIAVGKEYRKAGLGAELRRRIFQELKRRGFHRLYGGTLPSNAASLNLARSVGFREIADVRYRKILWVEQWTYKRVRG